MQCICNFIIYHFFYKLYNVSLGQGNDIDRIENPIKTYQMELYLKSIYRRQQNLRSRSYRQSIAIYKNIIRSHIAPDLGDEG
jgi:hypothetical protein